MKKAWYRFLSHVLNGNHGEKYSRKYHDLKNRNVRIVENVRVEKVVERVFVPYNDSEKELLIVNTDSLGDYVLCRNFLRYIKKSEKYKDYKITLVCTVFAEEIAKSLDSDIIDKFLVVPGRIQSKTGQELIDIKNKLWKDGLKPYYDTIWFPSFNSCPKRDKHEALFNNIGCRERIIYMDERNPHRNCSDFLKYTTVVINNRPHDTFDFELNRFFFEKVLGIKIDIKYPFIEPEKIIVDDTWFHSLKNEYIVINPCANDDYRMWNRNHWIDVIKYIKNVKKLDIVMVCGGAQKEYCEKILEESGVKGTLFAGLPFNRLLQVLKLAKMYIGQDSGIFHTAAALNVRTLCLSAGNAYFRFLQYPKERKHIKVVFPEGVEDWINENNSKDMVLVRTINCFYINQLTVPEVTKEIDNLLNIKDIIFVHKFRTINTGDLHICPYDYFKEYFDKYVVLKFDNDDLRKLHFKDSVFILGGGGFINQNDDWNRAIKLLIDNKKTVIGWGIGFNHHKEEIQNSIQVDLEKFTLLGLRDYKKGYKYLPCVSCLNKLFDKKYKSVRKIGCVTHWEFVDKKFDLPVEYNNAPLQDIIKFIGESDCVVTNTYHAMYWSTLLNKKVVLFDAFSDKFDNFKYSPTQYSGNLVTDVKKAKTYPDALAECRKANKEFFQKVKTIIEGK